MREKNQIGTTKKKRSDSNTDVLSVIKALNSELVAPTERNILERLSKVKKIRSEGVRHFLENAKNEGNVVCVYDDESGAQVYKDLVKFK